MSDKFILAITFSGMFALIGIILFLVGIIMLNNRKKKEKNCTSKTTGKVTDIIRHQSRNSDGEIHWSWHPVFEYNIGELKFIKESVYGGFESKYAIGQDVEIYYNPEDYNEYYVPGDTMIKTVAMILAFVGAALIAVAIFLAILILLIK